MGERRTITRENLLCAFEDVDAGPGCGRCETISDLRFESDFERVEMKTSTSKARLRFSVVYDMKIIFVLESCEKVSHESIESNNEFV